eukprot:187160-Hanusia_phi.AAC.1
MLAAAEAVAARRSRGRSRRRCEPVRLPRTGRAGLDLQHALSAVPQGGGGGAREQLPCHVALCVCCLLSSQSRCRYRERQQEIISLLETCGSDIIC